MDVLTRLKQNWKSGITVSLISLPLSVSLAVASQSTPTAGVITAVWAGLIASLFGGSNYNIVGPTGALSGILATYAIANGADALPTLAIASGLIGLAAYVGRLERFLTFIPGSTILGFTVGVAFVIGFGQFNNAVGLSGLPKHERFFENLVESFRHIGSASGEAVAVFLLFLAGLFLLLKLIPKIPGAILLSPFGILLGYLATTDRIPLNVATLGGAFPSMGSAIIQVPTFHFNDQLPMAAVAVAVVAILETMISAKIADGMTKTKHNERKEMLAVGLANLASGAAGGIPATAALARTSLNVKSGATDRMSATVNSIAVALISILFLAYFKYIPMPVIAAILAFVAIRMVEAHSLKRLFVHNRVEFWLAIGVAVVTVYQDPIFGILAGVAVSSFLFMEKLSRGQFNVMVGSKEKGEGVQVSTDALDSISESSDILVYSIQGQLAYINSKAHVTRFENGFNGHNHVVLRLRELTFVDEDGIDALDEIIGICKSCKKDVAIAGVDPGVDVQLERGSAEYRDLKKCGQVYEETVAALKHAGYKGTYVGPRPAKA